MPERNPHGEERFLHPEPVAFYATDHREIDNRRQLAEPSELMDYWKRAVETLATELQIEPIEAHHLLQDAVYEMTIGLARHWWGYP